MAEDVSFGAAKVIGFLGVVAGATIAILVPLVVLSNAAFADLSGFAVTVLCIIGVGGGVALSIVATVLSIVIPRKVSTGKD